MEDGRREIAGVGLKLRVCGCHGERALRLQYEALPYGRGEELDRTLECGKHYGQIEGAVEEAGINDWVCEGIVVRQRDGTAWKYGELAACPA